MPVHVASPFLNPNAGTRSAEKKKKKKTDKYKLLCQQRGMDFVPIIFTTSVGQFQRQYCPEPTLAAVEAQKTCCAHAITRLTERLRWRKTQKAMRFFQTETTTRDQRGRSVGAWPTSASRVDDASALSEFRMTNACVRGPRKRVGPLGGRGGCVGGVGGVGVVDGVARVRAPARVRACVRARSRAGVCVFVVVVV